MNSIIDRLHANQILLRVKAVGVVSVQVLVHDERGEPWMF